MDAGTGEQLAVVNAALCRCVGTNDFGRDLVDHDLRLYRVALFLAGVAAALLFFGRSTGVSVASTRTTSKILSDVNNAFFPGRRNSPLCISVFSTQRMIRKQTLSSIP